MKRSKIFLGLTTCILVIITLAVKSARFVGVGVEPCYTLSQNNRCTSYLHISGSTQNYGPQQGWSYNNIIGGGCVTPLYQPE